MVERFRASEIQKLEEALRWWVNRTTELEADLEEAQAEINRLKKASTDPTEGAEK